LQTASEKKPFRAEDAVEDVDTHSSGKERAHVHEAILWPTFDDFYDLYDKKRGRPNAESEWGKLTQRDREDIMQSVPAYVVNNPKEYRKDPERYLKHRTWQDEVIQRRQDPKTQTTDDRKQQLAESLAKSFADRRAAAAALDASANGGDDMPHA
jgi:hypothetical protein